MRKSSRILTALAALLLGLALVRPLWHIGLIAPQYPEGIGMYIWVNQITGQKPHDLQSINGLNHYIGMKPIVPESIPELTVLPAIVLGLIVLGLGVAVAGRGRLLLAWTGLLALLAFAGLADFWKWGYDYGHQLDPAAAIKVPGMSYQPPLIGSKQLLNFSATSWPALGGWAIVGALLLAIGVCLVERRANGLAGRAKPKPQLAA